MCVVAPRVLKDKNYPEIPTVITMVWTDPPTPPLSSRVLINDLDLIVEYQGKTFVGMYFPLMSNADIGGLEI